jgi:hypothetical protein
LLTRPGLFAKTLIDPGDIASIINMGRMATKVPVLVGMTPLQPTVFEEIDASY